MTTTKIYDVAIINDKGVKVWPVLEDGRMLRTAIVLPGRFMNEGKVTQEKPNFISYGKMSVTDSMGIDMEYHLENNFWDGIEDYDLPISGYLEEVEVMTPAGPASALGLVVDDFDAFVDMSKEIIDRLNSEAVTGKRMPIGSVIGLGRTLLNKDDIQN